MKFLAIFLYVSLSLVTVVHEVYGTKGTPSVTNKCEKEALYTYFNSLVGGEFNADKYKTSLQEFNDDVIRAIDLAAQLSLASRDGTINISNSKTVRDATRQLVTAIKGCKTTFLWHATNKPHHSTCSCVRAMYARTGVNDGEVDSLFDGISC